MSRQIVNTKSRGGGGFDFETKVAAYYMTLMLSAQSPFAPEFGLITRIDFQTQRPIDDLLLRLVDTNGIAHGVSLSVKSNMQFSDSKAPQDFVRSAWEQYTGDTTPVFEKLHDRLGLVTTPLPSKLRKDLNALLSMAQRQSTIDQIVSIPRQRLFESFACPTDLANKCQIRINEQNHILSNFEFPEFDFESPSSQDKNTAINVSLSLLARPDHAEAIKLWDRLCSIADTYRIDGGSLEFRTLIRQLQGFQLRVYPLYQHDWEILIEDSKDTLNGIPCTIGDIHIPRAQLITEFEDFVCNNRYIALLGPSGCGKSAVAKEFAEEQLASQIILWWHASIFNDVPDYAAFESNLGLQHRLRELLPNASSSMPFLIIDGIDQIYKDTAYRALSALIRNLQSQDLDSPWRIVLICQSEEWDRVRKRLAEMNLATFRWQSFVVKDFQPDIENLSPLWDRYPAIKPLFFQDRLRTVLCKPIILNALALNVSELRENTTKAWLGESDIIDWFWNSIVRRSEPAAIRSEVLMALAEKQAELFEHDIPEKDLPNMEYLSDLKRDGLCVSRQHDRITFYHDIYGDWSRLRRLLQLDKKAVPFIKRHLESPIWHKAIRLYGLYLIEHNTDIAEWQVIFDTLESENTANMGQILLLDAPIFASNAFQIFEKLYPILISNQGKLLSILLQRFLHVATLPDPRVQEISDRKDLNTYETLAHFRIPNYPLWPDMIYFLHNHKEQIISLVAGTTSAIADKWLRGTPIGYPLREEVAELGVLIAERVLHGKPVVGTQVGDYKAGLAAAHEYPERVAKFALEAAGRINTGHDIEDRYNHKFTTPWVDGPSTDVDHDFREQCLSPNNAGIINPLIDANPSVAREVILALLIFPPYKTSDTYGYPSILIDELEIKDIVGYFPPIYFHGPFLYFLRSHPDEGLELIIRLVDFATDRWADRSAQQGFDVANLILDFQGKQTKWIGDYKVYQWYQMQGNVPCPIACALMALEKWLYDKADAGESLDQIIDIIHTKSYSLAFIGVLCALGRKRPELFTGPLLPYLAVPELHNWEINSTIQSSWSWTSIGWDMGQMKLYRDLAYEWHNAPHRRYGMDQWAIRLFLTNNQVRSFLQPVIRKWKQRLRKPTSKDPIKWLEPLIPKFEMENYQKVTDKNGNVLIVYNQPRKLQLKYASRLNEIDRQNQLRNFVMKCRQILDGQLSIKDAGPEQFWQELRTVSLIPDQEQPEPLFFSNRSACCAGSAVLIEFYSEWLSQNTEQLTWCEDQLLEAVLNPSDLIEGDLEHFVGDDLVWDRFCSHAIPTLWQHRLNSPKIRRCIALLATDKHRNSIATLFWSASRYRKILGDNFKQLQHLLIRYASVYLMCDAKNIHCNPDFDWYEWRQRQVTAFTGGNLSPNIPSWIDIIQQEFILSESLKRAEALSIEFFGNESRIHKPLIDTVIINAAYSWLPELSAAIDEEERTEWIDFWKAYLNYILENHSSADLPYPSDRWVLSRLPGIIAEMRPSEDPASIWKPILTLPKDKRHWIESFIDDWFIYGLGDSIAIDNFKRQWIDMIELCFASEQWDINRSGDWYATQDLWTRLMGLYVLDGIDELWSDNKAELVMDMSSYFERWCDIFLQCGHCAQRYAQFLAQPAAKPVRIRSLVWLESGAKSGGNYWWKEHGIADSLAHLLATIWVNQQSELKQHPVALGVFMSFLSKLAAQLNPIALELESHI